MKARPDICIVQDHEGEDSPATMYERRNRGTYKATFAPICTGRASQLLPVLLALEAQRNEGKQHGGTRAAGAPCANLVQPLTKGQWADFLGVPA